MAQPRNADPGGSGYSHIVKHAPVALWEADISAVRARLEELKATGTGLREYAAAHPAFVQEALALIEVTEVTEWSLRLMDADRGEQLRGPLSATLRRESLPAASEILFAIDEGRTDVEVEADAVTLKGRPLHLLLRVHVPSGGAGEARMLIALADITARRESENRAQLSQNILRSIIESFPDPVFVKDASLRMVVCNSALSRNVGKEPEETYGKTDIESGWSPELVKGNPEKGIEGWEKDDLAALGGQTVEVRAEPSDSYGGVRYFDTVKFPLRDQDGTIIGIVGTGRDVTDQRRLQAELVQERRLLTVLLDNLPDHIYFKDRSGRFLRASRSHARSRGLQGPEGEIGRTDADYLPPEQAAKLARDEATIIRTGVPVLEMEEKLTVPTGGEQWFLTTKMPIKDDHGAIVGTFGISRDITRQKELQEALAREQYLFTLLMENLPDYIYFKDRQSRFIRMSRSHCQALGLRDPAEAVGKSDFDFYAPHHARKAFEDEQRIMSTGAPLLNQEELESYTDRLDTWAITSKMPLRDRDGVTIGTFGITHDITSRKRLELRNQLLATLVESSDDAIVGIDMDRRVTVWNRGAERVYGWSADEMIGTATSRLIPPELEEETRLIRERLARGEEVEHFETTRVRKDGAQIFVSLTLSAIRDASGKMVGMASVARDVTEDRDVRARLNRAKQLEGLATLAVGVAHHFNNINTVVKGSIDMLRTDPAFAPKLAAYTDTASAGLQRAVAITDQLLVLSGIPTEPSAAVRLDLLAQQLVASQEDNLRSQGVVLVVEIAESPPAQAEASRMQFVLAALLSNAQDSLTGCDRQQITVRTGAVEDGAFFEVEDTGCGIPEQDLALVFSPFYSRKGEWAPPGSPQSAHRGVGLGLAVCNAIVTERGGRIDVRSRLGSGSIFRVVLPAADQLPAADPPTARPS